MLSLTQAELLVGMISLVFAYLVSITVIGTIQALVAQWAGDSTPAHAGFLSLNPSYYIDALGFMCVVIFGFGWGRTIPFNPLHVDNPHRSLRVLLVYLIEPLMALVLAETALLGTLTILGQSALLAAVQSVFFDNWTTHRIPIYQLAAATHSVSQIKLALAVVCIAFLSINLFLAVWRTIHNACYYALFIGTENNYDYMRHMNVILFVAPLVLLLTVAPYLMGIFLKLLANIAFLIIGH